ncbi:MAG: recombinase family protein [Rubrivivax sp.]|nr:recombinase family protein [Pyrinomonadaceae bacterium]
MAQTRNRAALVYCRVSTKALAEGTSLESQKALCTAHAEALGYTVARVTQEIFTGASLFDRPKLSRDRADIRAGLFQAIIPYSVDRLTRSEAHLAILTEECHRAGCRLIFVTEALGALTPSDEARAAEAERRNISERVSRGHRFKLAQGHPVFTGWNLFGYRADREEGKYTIFEPEAALVRRVFSMCAGGNGMHRIASIFNKEGIPSPKSDRLPGAKWSSATLSDLLNNRSYMGEEYCLKTKRMGRNCDLPLPASEQVRLPDGVRPPLVSPELWETCQQGIRARAAKMNNRHAHPALLRGHIFCAECGARMIRNHFRRGGYEYLKYRCGSRWRPFDKGCRGAGVPLEKVEEWAWGKVESILRDPAAIERATKLAGPAPELVADLEAARREYERGSRQLGSSILELEARMGEATRCVDNLRRLHERCPLDRLTLDEQRLALLALGFKVYANGDDQTRWRYDVTIAANEADITQEGRLY